MTIEAVRERVNAATPGPWHYGFDPHVGLGWVFGENFNTKRGHSGIVSKATEADGEFIARARTEYPLALDVVEAAKEFISTLDGTFLISPQGRWWANLTHALEAFEAATN